MSFTLDNEDEEQFRFLFEVVFDDPAISNSDDRHLNELVQSKAPHTAAEFGSNFCVLGPYRHNLDDGEIEIEDLNQQASNNNNSTGSGSNSNSRADRKEKDDPAVILQRCVQQLRQSGIIVHVGRWLVPSSPRVVLFDLEKSRANLHVGSYLRHFQKLTTLHVPEAHQAVVDTVLFGFCVARFLAEFTQRLKPNQNLVLAHFYHWRTAAALAITRKWGVNIATLFTAHSTILGRAMSAEGHRLLSTMGSFDPDREAQNRGIYTIHALQSMAARFAHVTTACSDLTAEEVSKILGRKCDMTLPIGFPAKGGKALHTFETDHQVLKTQIHEVVRAYFYGQLDWNISNTLYFLLAKNRYEYRNTGIDLYLDALARLNQRLKETKSDVTVVAFMIVPAPAHSINQSALYGQAVTADLKDAVGEITDKIGDRLYEGALRQRKIEDIELISDEDIIQLKSRIFYLRRGNLPPVVTHNLVNDGSDPILNQLRYLDLVNKPSDRVKVIFHADRISNSPAFMNVDENMLIKGVNLGIFPSLYEPWGYHQLKCTAEGVPLISTNLAGFGSFVEKHVPNPNEHGLHIVDRKHQDDGTVINEMVDIMYGYCQKSVRDRITLRNRAEIVSNLFTWRRINSYYKKARHLALKRAFPDEFEPDYLE